MFERNMKLLYVMEFAYVILRIGCSPRICMVGTGLERNAHMNCYGCNYRKLGIGIFVLKMHICESRILTWDSKSLTWIVFEKLQI